VAKAVAAILRSLIICLPPVVTVEGACMQRLQLAAAQMPQRGAHFFLRRLFSACLPAQVPQMPQASQCGFRCAAFFSHRNCLAEQSARTKVHAACLLRKLYQHCADDAGHCNVFLQYGCHDLKDVFEQVPLLWARVRPACVSLA